MHVEHVATDCQYVKDNGPSQVLTKADPTDPPLKFGTDCPRN